MLVDTALLAQDLEDCREFINLILYLLEQTNLDLNQRDRFIGLLVKNLAYDLDMYLKVLRDDPTPFNPSSPPSNGQDKAALRLHLDGSSSDQGEASLVHSPVVGNVVSFPLESPG
jgi:hypothetical protein